MWARECVGVAWWTAVGVCRWWAFVATGMLYVNDKHNAFPCDLICYVICELLRRRQQNIDQPDRLLARSMTLSVNVSVHLLLFLS